MIDFLMISTRSTKRGVIEIYPKFIIKKSSDLMIRGGDFYAIWIEERGFGLRTNKMLCNSLTVNWIDTQKKAASALTLKLKFFTCGMRNPG